MNKILLIIMISCTLINANDSAKGQTYYRYILKPILGYNGAVFSKKYTKEQWEQIFKNNGSEFKNIFSKNNKEFEEFSKTNKFLKILPSLESFAIEYSKDSGTIAICGDDN